MQHRASGVRVTLVGLSHATLKTASSANDGKWPGSCVGIQIVIALNKAVFVKNPSIAMFLGKWGRFGKAVRKRRRQSLGKCVTWEARPNNLYHVW